jgi:hypothetical protein
MATVRRGAPRRRRGRGLRQNSPPHGQRVSERKEDERAMALNRKFETAVARAVGCMLRFRHQGRRGRAHVGPITGMAASGGIRPVARAG